MYESPITGERVDLGWGYIYPPEWVNMAYEQYRISGFIRMPLPEEVIKIPRDWHDDLMMAHQIVQFQEPDKKDEP